MDQINFKDETYKRIEIHPIPEEFQTLLTKIHLKKGNCLLNSYRLAEKNNTIEMAEGFLVTQFENRIEAVAHVWNKFGDLHFDISIDLIEKPADYIASYHFIKLIYNVQDARITSVYRTSNYNIFHLEIPDNKELNFKTNVKLLEQELRIYLNNLNSTDDNK